MSINEAMANPQNQSLQERYPMSSAVRTVESTRTDQKRMCWVILHPADDILPCYLATSLGCKTINLAHIRFLSPFGPTQQSSWASPPQPHRLYIIPRGSDEKSKGGNGKLIKNPLLIRLQCCTQYQDKWTIAVKTFGFSGFSEERP